jgi:hypothetical protein
MVLAKKAGNEDAGARWKRTAKGEDAENSHFGKSGQKRSFRSVNFPKRRYLEVLARKPVPTGILCGNSSVTYCVATACAKEAGCCDVALALGPNHTGGGVGSDDAWRGYG